MKYYTYRHIRPDKNEPFYIGKGVKTNRNHGSIETEYARAYAVDKRVRSEHWHNVYELCNKQIEVEILYESDDHEEIKNKEIEFIALYGRRDLGLGTLVNYTNGGDGGLGRVKSEEEKRKTGDKNRGKVRSPEQKLNLRKVHLGKPLSEAHRKAQSVPRTEEHRRNISKGITGANNPIAQPVLQFSKEGEFIKEWSYILEAATALNIHHPNISKCCLGKRKSTGGFAWKHKNLNK